MDGAEGTIAHYSMEPPYARTHVHCTWIMRAILDLNKDIKSYIEEIVASQV